MSVDVIDRGQDTDETEEQRQKREENIAKSPKPQFFKMRAEMLKQGRSNQLLAESDLSTVRLKVYASGGENGLHNHDDEDHMHIVMQGSACFYGPRGEEKHCGQYEGVFLPIGCYYRFMATSEEPLVLLRISAKSGKKSAHHRYDVYGEPLDSNSKENGRVDVIVDEGNFWGAAE